MAPRVNRLTNFYYAEYSPFSDPEICWNSDSSVAKYRIANSPSHAEWCNYLAQRLSKEERYEKWKTIKSKSEKLKQEVEEQTGWKVKMYETKVWYTYKPRNMEGELVEDLSYNIKISYFLRKWCLRLGWSFLPDFLELPNANVLKGGTYDPTGTRVRNYLIATRKVIDHWVRRRQYGEMLLKIIKEHYPNLRIWFDPKIEKLIFVLKSQKLTWLPKEQKNYGIDSITIEMKLDHDFDVIEIKYEYKCTAVKQRNYLKRRVRALLTLLQQRLTIFEREPLIYAFDRFMIDQESSQSS